MRSQSSSQPGSRTGDHGSSSCPVELFDEQMRCDANAMVVLRNVDGGQSVLHNGNQCGDQHELGDISMSQEASDHCCSVFMQSA